MKRYVHYHILFCLILLIITAFCYSNTLNTPFVFDDTRNIKDNPHIRLTKLDIKKIYDAGFKSPCSNRPFANISFAMNYYLGWYDVTGYHIVNIAIHFINAILIYLFSYITLLLLSGDASALQKRQRLWQYQVPAFIASLLWLSHPIQTQSVTYIVQRMNSMAVMFYMLSLLFYIYGRLANAGKLASRQAGKRWLLFIGCFVSWIVSLGTKEIAITLPLIILLYEWFFFQDLNLGFIKRSFKFWIGPVVIFAIFAMFLYLGADPLDKILKGYENRDFGLYERVLTQFRVVVFYISLLFYPHPGRLNLDHDIEVSHSLFDPITTLFSMLLIIGLILFASITLIRYKGPASDNRQDVSRYSLLLCFCIFWFFINLALESSVIGLEMAFEHRVYLPSISFFLAITTGVFLFVSRLGRANTKADKPIRMAVFISFLIISLLLVITTYQRNKVWHDDLTLWQDCVKKSPNKARTHANLGLAYKERGMLDKSLAESKKALEIDPLFVQAYNNIGVVYQEKGDLDASIVEFQNAIRISSNFATAYNNLSSVYFKKGMIDEAVEEAQKALNIDPDYATAHNSLACAYIGKGLTEKAIAEFQKAIFLSPLYANAYNNLGRAYNSKEMFDEAIAEFQKAVNIDPAHEKAHEGLGTSYLKKGMQKQAITEFRKALDINPDNSSLRYVLGNLYNKEGMRKEAIVQFKKALHIDPDNLGYRYTLGNIYYKERMLNEAETEYREVLKYNPENPTLYYKLGNIYMNGGHLDPAEAEFKKALTYKPEFANALNNLGIVYTKMKKYEKAVSVLKKKIAIEPDILDAYYNIACIYSIQNRVDEAVTWLKKAVQKGFKDWELLSTDKDLENFRGSSYYKKLMAEH